MQVQVIYVSRHGASSVMLKPLLKHLMVKLNRWNKWSLLGRCHCLRCRVYNHKLNPDMLEFIQTHRSDLYGRMWAGVAISLIEDERTWNGEKIGGPIYVRQYLGLFDRPPLALPISQGL